MRQHWIPSIYQQDQVTYSLTDLYSTSSWMDQEEAKATIETLMAALERRPVAGGDHDHQVLQHHLNGLSQHETARLMGCSQPSVGYRLQRARKRMRALAEGIDVLGQDLDPDALTARLLNLGVEQEQARILGALWRNPTQTAAGRVLGETQTWVSYRVRGLDRSEIPEVAAVMGLFRVWSRSGRRRS